MAILSYPQQLRSVGAESACSPGQRVQHINLPNNLFNERPNTELLSLMGKTLRAALSDRQYSWDDIAFRSLRKAMALRIITAVVAGERDLERLKGAALSATAGDSLNG
jgi:hypothetical protein